jgi:hypothetical protein
MTNTDTLFKEDGMTHGYRKTFTFVLHSSTICKAFSLHSLSEAVFAATDFVRDT